jgi:hypothetical protein
MTINEFCNKELAFKRRLFDRKLRVGDFFKDQEEQIYNQFLAPQIIFPTIETVPRLPIKYEDKSYDAFTIKIGNKKT